jgi:hypothetical protein
MTHGIFLRPGVVDGRDTSGRPVELPDRDGTGTPTNSPARARFSACRGDCGQDGGERCPHPAMCVYEPDGGPLDVFIGLRNAVLLTLAAVGAVSLLARVFG